ncbi:hypothetical protein CDAR_514931 [Caerostris darwini]|uniref:Uncharacterized protein n=1 Tax=Caerostris darwini TaxID=1538125 RepID=A0AAV4RDB3_9ARAC|nr:hypothetical protein CDAR_514931 [Caerostris darwini]
MVVIKSVSCSAMAYRCEAAEIESPAFAFGTEEGFYSLRNCLEKGSETIVIKRLSYSPTALHCEVAEIENPSFAFGTGEGFYSLRNCPEKAPLFKEEVKRSSLKEFPTVPRPFIAKLPKLKTPLSLSELGKDFILYEIARKRYITLKELKNKVRHEGFNVIFYKCRAPPFQRGSETIVIKRVSHSPTAFHCEAAEIENPAFAFETGEGFYSLRNCHEKGKVTVVVSKSACLAFICRRRREI